MPNTDVAIVGAGPYGLAAAAHLRRSGVSTRIYGDPMSFWRIMPIGMVLRSNWTATCIAEYQGPLSLDSFCAATGARFGKPIPLDRFIEYGTWVQAQVAPDVDPRLVQAIARDGHGFRLTLTDGSTLTAGRVAVAAGIAPFPNRPAIGAGLPAELASHTADHQDLSRFSGSRVLVVGGGQSALESAALLHESGAQSHVAVRKPYLNWLSGGKYQRMLGRWSPLLYAPTDVGPMGLSRLVAVPDLFRRLPRRLQDRIAARAIRPAGAAWLAPRLRDVPIDLGRPVTAVAPHRGGIRASFADGSIQDADHVLFGTGYRVDIARYPFLAPELLAQIQRVGGYPLLGPGLESSVRGLHFLGAPAAWSFGPIMRFVSGGWYAARVLTQVVTSSGQAPRPVPATSVLAATDEIT
jgi:FAD-dependent urate hydroxylase